MKSSDYELLKEIYDAVNRLESKLDARITKNSEAIDELEKFQYNLMGKIGIGVVIVGGAVAFLMNFVADWIKSKL